MTTITLPRATVQEAISAMDAALSDDKPYITRCEDAITLLRAALEQPQAEPWRPIESAPRNKTVLVHYKNVLGNGRTMRATYYPPETLESDTEEGGWADEGWYEESEAYEYLMPLEGEPTHWMPLPPAPGAADPAPNHAELLDVMVAGAAATADRTSELEALLAEARGTMVGAANYIDNLGGVSISYRQHIARIDAALGEKK